MKKNIFILILTLFFVTQSVAFSQSDETIEQKLTHIGLFSSITYDDKKEINKLFNNYHKWANKQQINKIKTLFAEEYKNFDGMSFDNYFKIVEDSWKLYSNVEYTTNVKKIDINGIYANVEIEETIKAQTKNLCDVTKKTGNIYSNSVINYNLKKFGKTWKIVSDNIIKEQTCLLYGEANDIPVNLFTPAQVANKSQYDVILDINIPKGYYAMGSITNEEIIYPQKSPKELFKNIKPETSLERVLTANNNNHNEYAVASIALTKALIGENNKISLKLVGLGFIMNRVNVLPLTKVN